MMETFPSEAALRCRLGVTPDRSCFMGVPRFSGDWVVYGIRE